MEPFGRSFPTQRLWSPDEPVTQPKRGVQEKGKNWTGIFFLRAYPFWI